jgi:hypothetical protein
MLFYTDDDVAKNYVCNLCVKCSLYTRGITYNTRCACVCKLPTCKKKEVLYNTVLESLSIAHLVEGSLTRRIPHN